MKKIYLFAILVLVVVVFSGWLVFKYQKSPSDVQKQTVQEPVVSVGSASVASGSTVDLPIFFTAGTNEVAALQFDLSLPSGLGFVSISEGMVLVEKTIQANVVDNKLRVIVFGSGRDPIRTGQMAVVKLKVASNLPVRIFRLDLSNIIASGPEAMAVKTVGVGGEIKVQFQ